ncbi:MAG: hypothetical protein JSS11_14555 [Verrucomicrobia bacterium]|nr:hypothetical protein [Verrucomicrobiota bacterium]
MRFRRSSHGKFLIALLLLLLPPSGRAQTAPGIAELGHPLIRNFTPRDYQAHPLCQAVIQGADGLMYFANNTDALAYDGAAWRAIKLPADSSGIRRFALAPDGTIYTGGGSVLGFFRKNNGLPEYVSLIDRLPPAERRFSEIYDVVASGDAVFFANEEKIFIWHDGRFTIVPCASPANSRGARLHPVNGLMYVTVPGHPLSRLVHDRLEVVADDPVFRADQVILIEAAPGGALRLLTAQHGFFQFTGGRVQPWATPLDPSLQGKQLNRAQRLADGSLAVAFATTSGSGGLLFTAGGQVRCRLDDSIGLLNPAIRDFASDREGGLWLGLESGAARLDWASGVTLFDATNGLSQAFVVDTVVQDGVRYVATIDGVYRLHPADGTGRAARFERIFNQPVYSLLAHQAGLLARGYTEIFTLTPEGFIPVAKSPIGMGALGQSEQDANRVWFTSSRGVHSLYHTSTGWRDEGAVSGFEEYANGQTEYPDGTLVVTTHSHGTFRLKFDHAAGFPRGPAQILRYDAAAQRYVPRDPAQPLPSDEHADPQRPNQDVPGSTWVTNNSPESAKRTISRWSPGGAPPQPLPHLVAETSGMMHRMREEPSSDGPILWVCGANGLVRTELAQLAHIRPPLQVLLRADGLSGDAPRRPDAPELVFEYVAPRYQPGSDVTYQTRLTGYETEWSPWSADRKRSFTRLSAGQYRFEVRARDTDGAVSPVVSRRFVSLPPWWLTWWFLTLAGLTGAGLIAAVTRWLATRALRRRMALLEAQSAIERERLRLARDLHDEVGSGLGRVILFAGEADRVSQDPAQLAAALQRVRATAQDLVQHARQIVWAVSPQHDTLASLVERLGDYTFDTLRAAGIACRLDLPAVADLPAVTIGSEMRHSLFLALKEAVHNCVKYSAAKDAALTLRVAGGFLEIILQDHGRGFAPGECQGSGHGLRNLALRAEALGGTGTIISQPGQGTTVTLRVPVGPNTSPRS